MTNFHPDHLIDLQKSGLSDKTIKQAGIHTVPPRQINKKLGFTMPGLSSMYEIPYPSCDGFSRFRGFYDGDKDGAKYLQRKGTGNHLYITPLAASILSDPTKPLYFTEGEKKALKACQEGLPCVAVGGLWNWKIKDGGLIPDFDKIELKHRTVYIVPDNDWRLPNKHGYKKNLEQAVHNLAKALRDRGAVVKIIILPDGPEKGLDDYLCSHTSNDLFFLEEEKLHKTEPQIKKKDVREKQEQPTQAEILLGIASDIILFHDQYKEAFCFIDNTVYLLKSTTVKDMLSYKYYKEIGKAPNSDALTQAINTLKGKANFECPEISLHNRIALHDNSIWYDNCDGSAIKITANEWQLTKNIPILFRRYSHQEKQIVPVKGGDPWHVFNFLNVDKEHQLLVLVYIISCFIPDIPHPIFHPHGAQGSGKTTFCRVCKSLIDPSQLETLIMQRDYAQLIQAIAHHHFVPFDNLSDLPGWASDILSIACTGGGLSKRQLYTDEDDVVLSVRRCIGINAINLLISRADLMDRAILLHLERINPSTRRDETEFWADFKQEKAVILGGIFDVLAAAMAIYPTIKLKQLPRMADFARWGYAIGESLQTGGGDDFLKAYGDNISRQNEEVIQGNTLIMSILKEMNEKPLWEGTIKSTYNRLREITEPDKNDPSFPKTERKLRAHLERARTTLMQQGIYFSIGERTAQGIPITFERRHLPENIKSSTSSTFGAQKQAENVDNVHNEANELDFVSFGKSGDSIEGIIS